MPVTSCRIPSAFCDCCANRSVSRSTKRCCRGRLGYARRTASGRSIGTAKWQDRQGSSRIERRTNRCRSACVKFTSVAMSVTNGFINSDCAEKFLSTDFADSHRFGLSKFGSEQSAKICVICGQKEMRQQFNEKNRDLIVNVNGRLVHR